MFNILIYETPSGNAPYHKFIEDLLNNHKERIYYRLSGILQGLEEYGLDYKKRNPQAIKPVRDGIYEIRASSSRVFFFCLDKDKIILLHGFEKKRNKIPEKEIKQAIKEKNDYLKG